MTSKIIQGLKFITYEPRITHYPDLAFLLATVPIENPNKTLPNSIDRNERTECIIRCATARKTILSIPNFPLPVPTPNEINYRIGTTVNMGLGMFATRDIQRGDLILAERPLILTPITPHPSPDLPAAVLQEQLKALGHFDWEEFLQPCFARLTQENQAAFRALANSHTEDGSGPLLGVIRTNGFGVTLEEGHLNKYTAVYKEVSRINHRCGFRLLRFYDALPNTSNSCRPNASNKFALATFSLQVRAIDDIKKGDELFLCYGTAYEPTPVRQAALAPYGFQCTCASCTSPMFDYLYQQIRERVISLSTSIDDWIKNHALSTEHLIKPALALVSLMDTNRLQCLNVYEINLMTLIRCYSALGDLSNTMKYANLCGLWHLVANGDLQMRETMKDPQALMQHPFWRARL